jgi:hypothetical protein
VGTQRRSWSIPAGKWISLICLGIAILFGALAVLSAAGLFDWSIEGGATISPWWGTSVFAVIFLGTGWYAFQPTWSVTVGNRGIGIRKLWRHVFVRWDEFEEAVLDGSDEPPRIRIVTKKGSLRISPRLNDPQEVQRHMAMIKRQK